MGSPPTPTPGQTPTDEAAAAHLAAESEARLTGARAVQFVTGRVQPPAFLYVTADDGLYVAVSNLQPSLALNMTATLLLPDGRVQANNWSMNPPSTGVQTPFLFPLAEGFLLNVSITPSAPIRYGMTFVFVTIRRGGLVSGINLQTLISDYVDAYGGPTWPGATIHHSVDEQGLILTQYTAAVTAGANYVFTVPSYARVMIHSLAVRYTASAAVASRWVALYIWDQANNVNYEDIMDTAIVASQSWQINWGLKLGFTESIASLWFAIRGLPEMVLMPGFQLILNVSGMPAGDQFQNVAINWEQWFSF